MGNCLVTKLAGSVNNSSLLKLGEIKVISNLTNIGNSGDYIRVDSSTDKPLTLKMETGYFRASKSSNDSIGTEITVSSPQELFPSTGKHVISVIPKYNIKWLQNIATDIDNLKFSKDLNTMILLSDSYGDISALKNLTELTSLIMLNTHVSGDISALGTLVNLVHFELGGTDKIVGNISSLKALSKLDNFKLKGNNIYGDLATIPAQCRFASLSNNAKFTWGARPASSKILAIESAPTISNIDKMLQDQAACQASISSSDPIFYKTISATGTRTSASDAAVATLQSKGYTLSIVPV